SIFGAIAVLNVCSRLGNFVPALSGGTLNIYSQVGLITLVGLVSKNGILIVEFANHLQERGRDKLQAVIEAAGTRLRPFLMTTAATVMGHLPLVFAKGPGAGARNSIGIMLVSGMIIGTGFTLFVVPAIYVLVARRHVAESAIAAGRAAAKIGEAMPEAV
ncbi:MAG TPA: efflux RND transporter permease subunit, partial [Candidatus Polarisedimenticolia bacterium]|nr:efflux RND transporter permease subunit [Candidatus Polarisedimenticolia bacterium]